MIRKVLIISGISFWAAIQIQAQRAWTLEQCIQHAMENNIQIKQSVLNTEYNENLLKQSKLSQIPSLNANANYSYSWGRALDQTTYQFTEDQQIHSVSMGLASSVTLFNGFRIRNSVLQNELNLMASYEDVEKIRNDIALNIAAAYLSILFNKELMAVTRNQLELTGQQVDRTRKLVEAGRLALGNQLEIEAQYAAEELNLINAENQLSISLLNLQQMLDLPIDTTFDVSIPELSDPDSDPLVFNALDVYYLAEKEMPEIRGAELAVRSSEVELRIAEGSRLPRLTMSANYNSGFSDIRQQVVELGVSDPFPIGITENTAETVYSYPQQVPLYGKYPFFEQIRDNTSAGLGLGLSIPIFNGWQLNTSIANARLSLRNAELDLQSRKLTLYATIQQAYADALAALKKFTATEQALVAMEESFKYTEKKFEVGLVNTLEYNTSKNQLTNTQSDLLQAKYDFIFRTKILNFYKGEPITL